MKVTKEWLNNPNMSIVRDLVIMEKLSCICDVYQGIRGTEFKNIVEDIRNLRSLGRNEEADKLKLTLTAFTASGCFNGTRNLKNFYGHSCYICLDLDDLTIEQLYSLKEKVATIPFTLLCFISPSGNGLKIIVKVNKCIRETHKQVYKEVLAYYESKLECKFDNQTNDMSRLCFFSYDPEAFFNENADVFYVSDTPSEKEDLEVIYLNNCKDKEMMKKFLFVKWYTEKKYQYTEGNRNNYIYYLSANCCRHGIPQNQAKEFMFEELHLTQTDGETLKAINSGYSRPELFGTWEKGFYPDMSTLPKHGNEKTAASTDSLPVATSTQADTSTVTTPPRFSENANTAVTHTPNNSDMESLIKRKVEECLNSIVVQINISFQPKKEGDESGFKAA